ncbi:MAG: hypothetical protein HQK52_21835 [Oligoflexia bacterium]|nr:hypothetical protein [Oligoflexia bacterium]
MRSFHLIYFVFLIIMVLLKFEPANASICIIKELETDCGSNLSADHEEGTPFGKINGEDVKFYKDTKSRVIRSCLYWTTDASGNSTLASRTKSVYVKSTGCFSEDILVQGINYFKFVSQWGDENSYGSGKNKYTLKDIILCEMWSKEGKRFNSCNVERALSLNEVAPQIYEELESKKDNNRVQRNKLGKLLEDYEIKEQKFNILQKCVAGINANSIDDYPVEACGAKDIQEALINSKKDIENLKKEIELEKNKIRAKYQEIADVVEQELSGSGVKPEDIKDLKETLDNVTIPELQPVPLPEKEIFDSTNDVYAKYAIEVILNLEKAITTDDRFEFLVVAESWLLQVKTTFEMVSARAQFVEGEIEAFLDASARVEKVLEKHLELDEFKKGNIGFKDSSIPDDLKSRIKNLASKDKYMANKIQRSLIYWKGELTPEQVSILGIIGLLINMREAIEQINLQNEAKKKLLEKTRKATDQYAEIAMYAGKKIVKKIPFVKDVINLCELATGKAYCNLVDGKNLSALDRAISGLSFLTGGVLDELPNYLKVLKESVLGMKTSAEQLKLMDSLYEMEKFTRYASFKKKYGKAGILMGTDGDGPLEKCKYGDGLISFITSLADTFSTTYVELVLTQDLPLYRAHPKGKSATGLYWSKVKPNNCKQTTLDIARDYLDKDVSCADPFSYTTLTVPKGTTIYEGVINPLMVKYNGYSSSDLYGGDNQIIIKAREDAFSNCSLIYGDFSSEWTQFSTDLK